MSTFNSIFAKVFQNGLRDYRLSYKVPKVLSIRAFSSSSSFRSSYSRTEVSISVPITKGHLAAQLWEQNAGDRPDGQKVTPIICMHGFQDNSSTFDPLIPLILRDGMTIVSVDLPGHGLSSHLTGAAADFALEGVSVIHRVMRHFQWDKVTLIGHSYGAILSFSFATTYAEKVEKFVAIENFHCLGREANVHLKQAVKRLFEVEEKLSNPNKKQPSYTLEELVKRTSKGRKGTVTEDGVRILLKRGALPDPENPDLYRFTHDLKTNIPSMFARVGLGESEQLAKNIKCPVCVIKGDPGEDYEPRENFIKVIDSAREANGGKLEFHLVKGSHHLHLNTPELVAPIISKFLGY